MPEKRINLKNYLIFIILVGAVVLSYFYSGDVYSYYMRYYYEKIRGQSTEQQLQKAREMYDNHDYEKLRDELKTLTMVYPDNRELKKLEGLTLIKLGEPGKGAELILAASDGERMPEKLLEETVSALFEKKMYRDIIINFKKNSPGGNPNLLFRYGVSLYETGDYERAVGCLKRALNGGKTDYEIYHYLGLAFEKSGDTRASLPYLEHARNMNADDPDVGLSLANAYRKLGRYNEAAKIMRKIRR
jgi:tetratricopeptide (TPR) repeat protein